MELNKKEIIDEIILLEPELENQKEKLENIFDTMILSKPNISISSEFKNDLKNELLNSINDKSIITKNSFSFIKYSISFILGGASVFGLIGILGININFEKIDYNETKNVGLISDNSEIKSNIYNQEKNNDNIKIQRGLMRTNTEFNEETIVQEKSIIINNSVNDTTEKSNVTEEQPVEMTEAMSDARVDIKENEDNTIEIETMNNTKNVNIITEIKSSEISETRADINEESSIVESKFMKEESISSINKEDEFYIELKTYLENLGLSIEQIKQIINIIKKYN